MKRVAGGLCLLLLSGCSESARSPAGSGECGAAGASPATIRYLGNREDNKALLGSATRHVDSMLVPSRAANIVVERLDPSTRAAIEYAGGARQLHFNKSRALLNVMVVAGSTFTVTARRASQCCFRQTFRVDREGVWLLKMGC